MSQMKHPLLIILLALLFLTISCTDNNSITGNNENSLTKPTDITEIATGDDDEERSPTDIYVGKLIGWMIQRHIEELEDRLCYISFNEIFAGTPVISKSYDFRDNYLSRSEKGEVYAACYYLLSNYGIENNLVNKYHKEHYELLKSSVNIAFELQYGSSNDKILIKNEFSDDLQKLLKIYKNHENHRNIDPVLDYLEIELKKYENEPKYKIAADFEK